MCGAECPAAWLAPNCPRRGLSLSSVQDLGGIQGSPVQSRAKVPWFNGKRVLRPLPQRINDLPLPASFGSSQLLELMCRLLRCVTPPRFTKDRAPVKSLSDLVRKTWNAPRSTVCMLVCILESCCEGHSRSQDPISETM